MRPFPVSYTRYCHSLHRSSVYLQINSKYYNSSPDPRDRISQTIRKKLFYLLFVFFTGNWWYEIFFSFIPMFLHIFFQCQRTQLQSLSTRNRKDLLVECALEKKSLRQREPKQFHILLGFQSISIAI